MLDPVPLVYVFGFCFTLILFPSPVPFFPIVGALLMPNDVINGGYIGMVAGMFFGTVQILMYAMLSVAKGR